MPENLRLTAARRVASRAGWRRGRAGTPSRSSPRHRSRPRGRPPPPKGQSPPAGAAPRPYGARHVLERDGFPVALLDKAEDLSEQGLVLEPEVPHDVGREPRQLHEQEGQVREDGLPVAVPPAAEFRVEGREALGPRPPLLGWHLQAL